MSSTEQTRLEKDFLEFHRKNPHVWELFKMYTNSAMKTGRRSYSAYAIFERIRWHQDIETEDKLGSTIPRYISCLHRSIPNTHP